VVVTVIAYSMEEVTVILNGPLNLVHRAFPKTNMDLISTSPMSVFSVLINICLIGGVILSLPFWIFFLGQFVAPALTERERRVLVPTGLSAFALFLAGVNFGYYVLTYSSLRVAVELNIQMGYSVMWTAEKYYSLLMWMTLGMGAAFEFPLIVVLAVYLGLIEVATLVRYWRHAIVVIFIIAAVVTPTPDPVNMAIFALPLMLLYGLSIVVASQLKRRRADEVAEV
jgi:sec-independent protein translocase protein TatC